jgi:peptide/nickel transport system permease protein
MRLVKLVIVLLLVSIAAFSLLELAPGSPLDLLLPEGTSAEVRQQVAASYGLNDPLMVRYIHWMGNVLQGDLGRSIQTNVPVADAIWDRLPVTAELAGLSTLLALVIAVPLGVYCGYRPGSRIDRIATTTTSAILSIPGFLAALVLIYVFSVTLGMFPVQGWQPWSAGVGPHLQSVALPVVALALSEVVVFQRLLRGDMATTLQQDFVMSAKARGIPIRRILFGHALRPSSFSMITVLGVSLGRAIGGTVIIESLFSLPGLGTLVINSVSGRDYVTVQGIVLVVATAYVVLNALVDLAYPILDPRVRST